MTITPTVGAIALGCIASGAQASFVLDADQPYSPGNFGGINAFADPGPDGGIGPNDSDSVGRSITTLPQIDGAQAQDFDGPNASGTDQRATSSISMDLTDRRFQGSFELFRTGSFGNTTVQGVRFTAYVEVDREVPVEFSARTEYTFGSATNASGFTELIQLITVRNEKRQLLSQSRMRNVRNQVGSAASGSINPGVEALTLTPGESYEIEFRVFTRNVFGLLSSDGDFDASGSFDIQIIPAPGTGAVLALGAFVGARRRR